MNKIIIIKSNVTSIPYSSENSDNQVVTKVVVNGEVMKDNLIPRNSGKLEVFVYLK